MAMSRTELRAFPLPEAPNAAQYMSWTLEYAGFAALHLPYRTPSLFIEATMEPGLESHLVLDDSWVIREVQTFRLWNFDEGD